MIFIEVNFSMFCDQFHFMGRQDQFTYEGKKALFRWLDEMYPNEDMNESIELDVIALCCDYSEYTLEELHNEYKEDDETPEETLERIKDNTTVLETEGDTYVIASF